MNIKYYDPDTQINGWVKKYFILDHNDSFGTRDINWSVSPLTGNCWFFIISDLNEDHDSDNFGQFFEIDNFSKRIAKCNFKYNNKFRLLCVQFEMGIPIRKVIGMEYHSITDDIRMILNFEILENDVVNHLNRIFSNFNTEKSYKQRLTAQIIHFLKANPALKINDLSNTFYLCSRQIQRIFQEQTGYSLKSCQKYLRINEGLYLMLHSSRGNLSNVIYSLGYYDHNHFLKDFKIFYGATPSHLIKRKALCFNELFFDATSQKELALN